VCRPVGVATVDNTRRMRGKKVYACMCGYHLISFTNIPSFEKHDTTITNHWDEIA
jgi:hypothetical protein